MPNDEIGHGPSNNPGTHHEGSSDPGSDARWFRAAVDPVVDARAVPDVWPEIRARVTGEGPTVVSLPRVDHRRLARPGLVAIAAGLIVVGIVSGILLASRGGNDTVRTTPGVSPQTPESTSTGANPTTTSPTSSTAVTTGTTIAPPVTTVPTTTPEAGARAQAQAEARAAAVLGQFRAFAADPTTLVDSEPSLFADHVRLGLGPDTRDTASRKDLADPATWRLDANGYAARSGPISALDLLTSTNDLRALSGVAAGCPFGFPLQPPIDETKGERIVSIETTAPECLQYFDIVLTIDVHDEIVAVNVFLWEP